VSARLKVRNWDSLGNRLKPRRNFWKRDREQEKLVLLVRAVRNVIDIEEVYTGRRFVPLFGFLFFLRLGFRLVPGRTGRILVEIVVKFYDEVVPLGRLRMHQTAAEEGADYDESNETAADQCFASRSCAAKAYYNVASADPGDAYPKT